jgi:methylmalonyl-CoA/ethylmalonyl-CoA epimerase
MELDHIGVAVRDLVRGEEAWARVAAGQGSPEMVGDDGVKVLFCPFDGGAVELLEPSRDESPVGRFLERRGEGLHHVAFRVPDIRAALQEMAQTGVELIDREPRPGAHGTLVAFLHPKSFAGVLVELVEHPGDR